MDGPLTLATLRAAQGAYPAYVSQESVDRLNRLFASGALPVKRGAILKPVVGYGVSPTTGEYERNRDEEPRRKFKA